MAATTGKKMATRRPAERGSALILVTVVLIVVLVGGLAAVAVTSGELSSSRGYRTRQSVDACADAGLEQMRSLMPDTSASNAVNSSLGSHGLRYHAGHYNNNSTGAEILDQSMYDASSLMGGERITNVLPGGNPSGISGVRVMAVRATCTDSGRGAREMETVFRYGIPIE